MTNNDRIVQLLHNGVIVVFKQSRYTYVLERGAKKEKQTLSLKTDSLTKDLLLAHEKNLLAINDVKRHLTDLGIKYQVICRNELTNECLRDRFIIAIGGDGTILDTSHYCDDSPILGVNSDPDSSIGAFCAATCENFRSIFLEILHGSLLPTPLSRLSLTLDNQVKKPFALNDMLFCHKNPAAMSRFTISFGNKSESFRSSGIWIATAAGSTGGIYSSGAMSLAMDRPQAIFHLREPYWSNKELPELLYGNIFKNEVLTIVSTMTDGQIFIDGPHKFFDISLGEGFAISLADRPLWLFDGPRLHRNRDQIIKQRNHIRRLMKPS
jgi:NAD+ kinase